MKPAKPGGNHPLNLMITKINGMDQPKQNRNHRQAPFFDQPDPRIHPTIGSNNSAVPWKGNHISRMIPLPPPGERVAA